MYDARYIAGSTTKPAMLTLPGLPQHCPGQCSRGQGEQREVADGHVCM